MSLAFNAEAAGHLQATVQFHLNCDGGSAGYLQIESGRCALHPGETAQPTLVIERPTEVWTAIARGEINGAETFLSGAYRATGATWVC